MTILILNRSAMSYSAYHEWFDLPEERPLVYFSAPGRRDLPPKAQAAADRRYAEIREYQDYDTSDQLECDVLDLHAASPVRAIVAMSEWDQIRAGRLRERLGLPGTTEAVARAYRDKLEMKRRLSAAGVAVADFAPADNATDLVGFIDRVGYPVLVKPRLMAASQGLTVLREDADLRQFVRQGFGLSMEAQRLQLVEKMVRIRAEYHVDGIVVDGALRFVWPSRYVGTISDFESDALFGSVMLHPDNPRRAELCDLIAKTIAALPRLSTSTFHAEVFETEDGQLLLNEIAARTGGFRINDHIKAAFGLWLNREWARLQAGLPAGIAPPEKPRHLAGSLMLRPRPGTILSIPERCPMTWVFDYRTDARPGDRFGAGTASSSQLASAVITGATEEEVEARLHELYDWFHATLRIDASSISAEEGHH